MEKRDPTKATPETTAAIQPRPCPASSFAISSGPLTSIVGEFILSPCRPRGRKEFSGSPAAGESAEVVTASDGAAWITGRVGGGVVMQCLEGLTTAIQVY